MQNAIPFFAAALIGYVLGSANLALLLGKWKKVDMRAKGSGNLGASNAMILMGWGAGVAVALHDIGKGVLSVALARWLFPGTPWVGLCAGVAAVLGHNFPFYLHFRGGKGFATYFGMVLIIHWKFALALAVTVLVLTLVTDYIVIGTMTTVVSFPVFLLLTRGWVALLIVLIASAAVIWKHRENFVRLKNGTEVGLRKANRGDLREK